MNCAKTSSLYAMMAESICVPYDTSRIEKLEKRRYAIEGYNKVSIISADKTDRYSALRGAK